MRPGNKTPFPLTTELRFSYHGVFKKVFLNGHPGMYNSWRSNGQQGFAVFVRRQW